MGDDSPAQILMKKGRRGAAAHVHADCANNTSSGVLGEILDILLNPSKNIDEWETLDWIKWLMAGGRTPDEFSSIVRRYDNATTCGLVWTANFVAYRCRTCGISPCMSLCAECFQKGDHDGHDFNMFRSQAGGACDCGDTSVMKETGFCDRHGPQAQVNKPCVPSDLMCTSEAIMPRLILRLIQHLRENSKSALHDAHIVAIMEADNFLTMLHEFSAMGAAMRRVMTAALTNPQLYKHLTECCENAYMTDSQRIYKDALDSLPNPEPHPQYLDCPALSQTLVHKTFLEELVFWTVKFEFPQKVVCLLLNMLPDPDYKEALTQAFVLHYSRISMMLECSSDPDTLSNRVVHVSVQLFSNEALALRMVDKLNLLHVMVTSLKYMMSKILIPNTLHCPEKNFHLVVDCGLQVMKEHCYWPLVSDLNNVLSHRPVAVRFMSDNSLLEMWFDFLSMFQGMNVNQRELVQHVEFEPNTYYAAFSAELEASAYPMWALLSHLRDTSTLELTKRVLASCLSALRDWLEAINMTQPDIPDSNQVSFHLPLHRYLSVFMCQAINVQGVSLQEVLPPQDMLQLIMMHPLRVQAAFYEILNGLWVRNGLQIKGQAMTYIQCNFCNSMVDADMYLLQICATQIPADTYIQTVIDKFHIKEWLSFVSSPMSDTNTADSESETPMLESCLTFLASLISLRTNLGAKPCALSQLEMVTLLCMCDKTHSQLMELMPERCGTAQSRDFESVLQEVADYKAPNLEASGNMQQGMYVPKAKVWEQLYDPIHVLLRAVHRRDFQNSMDRFSEYAQQIGRIRHGTTAWPPFRTPWPVHPAYQDPRKVLRTKVFHALVWTVLYKATMEHTVSEHVTAILIYLLEQAIAIDDPQDQLCPTTVSSPQSRHVRDTDLGNWFETDWLSCNLRTVIQSITLPEPIFVCDSDSDSEWVQVRSGTPTGLPQVPSMPALLPANDDPQSQSMALVPHTHSQAAIEGSEPMEALPPSTQPLAVTAGNEMISASSFQHQPSSSSGSSNSLSQMINFRRQPGSQCLRALPGPSSSGTSSTTVVQLSKRSHSDRSKQPDFSVELPSPERSIEANESIISLLLKLHSHLSGAPDSFNPDELEVDRDSRIGDGAFFVGKVLRRIMEIDSFCRDNVVQTRERLWPRQPEEGEAERREREEKERAERRRKAKERQQKLMEEFASKQKQFMEKAMETEDEALGMDWDGAEQVLTTKKEYDCVICSQTSPSTDEKPMGLAVLVQATSVLGHKRRSADPAMLPTSDEERQAFQQTGKLSLAADFDRKIEELDREFDQLSWLVSVNLGWEGGVHVQTCGHHLHLDCLKAYLRSLRNQQRLSSERGEYSCPLCRRLANSVLPLPPQLGECAAVVRSRPVTLTATITELVKFLKENPPTNSVVSNLMEAMRKSMEDMTNSTYLKFKQKSGTRLPQTLFLFVTSIARTNLEVELVQREGSLVTPKSTDCIPKRSCIMPLLHVLAVHARMLAHWPTWETFRQLSGATEEPQQDSAPALSVAGPPVPLLLCDPCALLTQFILLLPLHLDQTYFSCVVKLLYNLLYVQVTVQLSCLMSESQRSQWRRSPPPAPDTTVSTLDDAMALTIHLLDHTSLYLSDEARDSQELPTVDRAAVENQIQQLCLPFLRIAALLRHHLYEQELPKIHTESSEFVILVYYLELVEGGMTLELFNAAVALSWPEPTGCHLLAWTRQLSEFINHNQVTARSFLSEQHLVWHQPRLLSLPELYDKIFQYYHRRQCSQCHSVPRETSVCLVCGALVCLKENCCKQLNVCEAVQHSVDCGAGTAMYLVVTSSYVIVIRGKRACLWGSVYLDSFGEEDRELKRGKPLYLSPGRYQLLQQQWLGHHFDHTPKKWVWHRDAL
ncbi:E3 ubiquitin-protein ligase Ubr3-like isoform X1 [Macrosteles quadrilineatus]|uniref:E3 ubiquitin-protein ligase Ubr3-like isoform X1 n=1 Tax=Macrosteles quadrilineatus TaxID=74068 RepID=UPI0023E1D9F5|nr:E3 ubiquitin-protein ligase Ubr3-like isoform X1 [Macrosteles quadrilineatus]